MAMFRRAAATVVVAIMLTGAASCDSGPGGGAAPAPAAPAPAAPAAGHGVHPPAPLRDRERFTTVGMPRPYTPTAPQGATDEYRCFLVDPALRSPAFLTGSQFLPQNAHLVHHAIFFRVAPSEVATAERADAQAPGEGWTCFGNAGIGGDAAWVAHWAPGTGEMLMAPGIGYRMPAGSRLVMQVHYNLLGTQGRPGGNDRSEIRLRLSDRDDLRPLHTATFPAPVELPCTPEESGPLCDREAAIDDVARRFGEQARSTVEGLNGACHRGRPPTAGTEQSCDRPVPVAGTVYAVAGHMHLLGRSIRVRLNPGTARATTLLDIPAYDFDAQTIYPLPEPVAVRPGDVVRVTCTHDAGLRRRLPALRSVPARYVVWGEGTSDEMCLSLLIWSPAA